MIFTQKHTKRFKEYIKIALAVLFGNALLAFDVTAFIIPNNIIIGGTTGIALLMGNFLPVNTAAVVFALNSVLLVMGLIIIGKKLFFTSVASTFLYPLFLSLMQRIPNIDSLSSDTLLSALFAGVLMGFSIGLVMRFGSSTGGMDITNLILAKLFHKSVAVFVYITDIIVVSAQALVSDSESILLGIVVLVLEAFVIEQVTVFGKAQLELFIITNKYDEIRLKLLGELNAGVTMSYIQTGALKENAMGIICVIPPRKLYFASEIIKSIDPAAFITVTKIKEVRGQGFTAERKRIDLT